MCVRGKWIAGRRYVLGALFLFHFLLIGIVSSRSLLSSIAQGSTILPPAVIHPATSAEDVLTTILGENLSAANLVRQSLAAYLHLAGIEAGYGYFAPNVPDSYKLVFEIKYPDGRTKYALPEVGRDSTGLRLNALFSTLGHTREEILRELILQRLAYSAWQGHPDATSIRAVFGVILLPTLDEAGKGKKESYQFLYAYNFIFEDH